MTHADRDIDGALNQRFGDTSPKVGDWEPSNAGIGCGAVLLALILILAIWGWLR